MQFSNTTSKDGLIQDCEFWTGLGDARISGNATLLKVFTNRLNREYNSINAFLRRKSGLSSHDDYNYDNEDFSTFSFSTTGNSFQFLTTEDGDTITDIAGVSIQESSGSVKYVPLEKLTVDNAQALQIMSPDTDNTGIPTGYLERNNTIFFNCIPSFSGTGKLFFKRVPSYFTSSDTTKTPGFDADYHQVLSRRASLAWLLVNKAESVTLVSELKGLIKEDMDGLESSVAARNPTRHRIVGNSLNAH